MSFSVRLSAVDLRNNVLHTLFARQSGPRASLAAQREVPRSALCLHVRIMPFVPNQLINGFVSLIALSCSGHLRKLSLSGKAGLVALKQTHISFDLPSARRPQGNSLARLHGVA